MAAEKERDSRVSRPGRGGALFSFLEQHRFVRAVGIGLSAALLALSLHWADVLERAELASYDMRVRAMAPGGRSGLIEIVDYDEPTIQEFGDSWGRFGEWPRDVHADVLGFIARGQPKVIVYDVLFAEGGASVEDRDLAVAVGKAGSVVLACYLERLDVPGLDTDRYRYLSPKQCMKRSLGPAGTIRLEERNGTTWPYAGLLSACYSVGTVHLETDRDKVARSVSPACTHSDARGGKWMWPSLSTSAAWAYFGKSPVVDGKSLSVGGRKFSTDGAGRRLIYWYGPCYDLAKGETSRYRITPAYWLVKSLQEGKDLIDPVKRFKDKIVVVGTSAVGNYDLRYTPMGHEPGMCIHAAAIENLISGDSVVRVSGFWTQAATVLICLVVCLAFPGRGWRAVFRGGAVWLILTVGYLGFACWSYAELHLWVGLVVPQVGGGLSLAAALFSGYLVEGRRARRLRRGMSRFLSPEVLAEVADDLDNLRPGMGKRREVSMMFCDVRNFTTMSEKLEPEAVMEILGVYLGSMTDVIMDNGGTLSKYLGDGIMAFWGAPLEIPDHAERAARAALDMIKAQEEVKKQLSAAGRPIFDIGIGLHVGDAVIGTVGSERRLEYTAIGDTVNLASRVESLTKEFKVRICVTSDFARGLREMFEFRELGSVKVKGRSADVKVYELQSASDGDEGLEEES